MRKTPLSFAQIAGGFAVFATCFFAFRGYNVRPGPDDPTPPILGSGWNSVEAKSAETLAMRALLPKFAITGVNDSKGKKAFLWTAAKAVLGQHVSTWRQEIGDCVSMGMTNACSYLQCVEIAADGVDEYHQPFPPFIYGISRHQVGRDKIGGDGSVGAWAAEGVQKYGVLPSDGEGVPPYSGSIAKRWGGRSGPPKEFLPVAAKHLIKTFSPVKNYADVRDAIVNGYPVTIASDVGFEGGKREVGGKIFLRRGGSWGHQMSIIGVDDTVAGGAAYIMNSWGETAHPAPAGDEPPGGFWVTGADVDAITKQQDSYCYSSFDGFPARDLDLTVIGKLEERLRHDGRIVRFVGLNGPNSVLTVDYGKAKTTIATPNRVVGVSWSGRNPGGIGDGRPPGVSTDDSRIGVDRGGDGSGPLSIDVERLLLQRGRTFMHQPRHGYAFFIVG